MSIHRKGADGMIRRLEGFMIAVLVIAVMVGMRDAQAEERKTRDWPQFRGPDARGVAEGSPTPTRWDVTQSENLLWKTPIAGLGHSSPVIWGDRVFVTSAVSGKSDAALRVGLYGDIASVDDDTEHRWMLYCLDKTNGKVVWEQTVHTGVPRVKRHTKSTHANSTPATDGKHIVTFFGSEGLYCHDMDGKLLWKKDFGLLDSGYYMVPQAQWEFGSSPVIHDGVVIVQCDVQKGSFIAAFNVNDGKEIWRASRDEVPTWSTPTVHVGADRTQVIANGLKHIGGYDFKTGKELWKLQGGGDIPVPTPIVAHDLIFITNAHGMAAPFYAVRTSAEGDVSLPEGRTSGTYMAWSDLRTGIYMQTPLVYGDRLYACRDNGVLAVYDARTGQKVYRERLGGGSTGFTASAVAADDKVYFTSEEGNVYVVKAGDTFDLLATNPLGEVCMATPAVSEGVLFFRTQGHLVAIGEKSSAK